MQPEQIILLKRSLESDKVPESSQLQDGEMAINVADGRFYYKHNNIVVDMSKAINVGMITRGVLNVEQGGTGTTTSTGTGSTVLNSSPDFSGTPTVPTAVYGTTTKQIASTEFVQEAKGAFGGGTDKVFMLSDVVISESYTIPEGKNALTAGPVTIGEDAAVTVPEGSVWTIA